eukprot:PITA_25649
MVEECNSIMVNDVWEIVLRPQDRSLVGSRWIYKIKYATDGSVEKYKTKFVAKGYAQKEGIDYEKTFAPVARSKDIRLSGFTDADWARSLVDWKSTSRYYFNIGSRMTSWCSRKQKSVALSSAEAEYMAASTASCQAMWLRKLLVNLFRRNMEATGIMCDNKSCIKLSENLVFHDRSKHIDIRCHFVKDCVQRGAVYLSYTPTGEQGADILTKALGRTKFDYFREKMGMIKNPFQSQKWG